MTHPFARRKGKTRLAAVWTGAMFLAAPGPVLPLPAAVTAQSARPAHAAPGGELAAILENTAEHLGVARQNRLDRPLVLRGRGTFNGIEGSYRLTYSADGSFVQEFRGAVTAMQGFDGDEAWMLQHTGATVDLDHADREMVLTSIWVQTGYWLATEAPLEIRLVEEETDSLTAVLEIGYRGGIYSGRLSIDRETGLPSSWSSVEMGRLVLTRFERYRRHRGVNVPTRVVVTVDGHIRMQAVVDDIDTLPDACQANYGRAAHPEIEASFRPDRPPELDVEKRGRGHIFVRVSLDGRDAGWFLFDTGAAGTFVSSGLARELGLEPLGSNRGVGVAGEAAVAIAKVDEIELGPLVVRRVPIGIIDLGKLAHQRGFEIKGIIGNNVIGQAVVEYDVNQPRVALFEPRGYELTEGTWQPLTLSSGKPVARVRYEGHEGLFTMDTAASGNLLIHTPTVERQALLADRETRPAYSFGVGGSIEMKAGYLEWIEFGGQRFADMPVRFATQERGTGADRLRDGILGFELMRYFRIVFDFPRSRIALIERASAPGPPR